MPELPEVETIRRALQERVRGETIQRIEVLHPDVIAPLCSDDFCKALQGAALINILRRGKYLLCELDKPGLLCIHLRMTGQLHWLEDPSSAPLLDHTHLILHMVSGKELRYVDVRRFGKMRYLRDIAQDPTLLSLGLEPLDEELTASLFHKTLGRYKSAIKSVILRQDVLAGMGNIYSDEALFLAGIHPQTRSDMLDTDTAQKLLAAMRQVLLESIECHGSSMRDYCNIDGVRGSYQERWRIYHRTGQPCLTCETKIKRIKVGGRSSHFCPKCQVPGVRC